MKIVLEGTDLEVLAMANALSQPYRDRKAKTGCGQSASLSNVVTIGASSPIELAMSIKGMFGGSVKTTPAQAEPSCAEKFHWEWPTKNIAQVGDDAFVWFDEAGLYGGITYSVDSALGEQASYMKSLDTPEADPIRTVEYELVYENGSHELARYGDCLYVVFADGMPVWTGHSVTEGRKSVDARERAATERPAPEAPTPPAPPVKLVAPTPADKDMPTAPVHIGNGLQKQVSGPGFVEPLYEEDTPLLELKTYVQPADESGYYWAEGTHCQYSGCKATLKDPGRSRENGYCAHHRNS